MNSTEGDRANPKRRPNPQPPSSILQVMSGGRVRIDPSTVADLAAWLWARGERYRRTLRQTTRGLSPEERLRVAAHKEYARKALGLLAELMSGLLESVESEDVHAGRELFRRGLHSTYQLTLDDVDAPPDDTDPPAGE